MAWKSGRCLCGKTQFEFKEDFVLWRGYCHCESCRRATGAAVSSFFGVAEGNWQWTGEEPRIYRSSPGVERRFCRTCGSPVSYCSERYPGEMHFHLGTLEYPEAFRPEFHTHWHEKLPWLRLDDDLLRFSGSVPGTVD